MVSADKIVSIVSPESAPIKRIIQEAKDKACIIDASQGRKTKAVIITDSDHVILSALTPEKIVLRMENEDEEKEEDNE